MHIHCSGSCQLPPDSTPDPDPDPDPNPPCTHNYSVSVLCAYKYLNAEKEHEFSGSTLAELEVLLTTAPMGIDDKCIKTTTCSKCSYTKKTEHTHSSTDMIYYLCNICNPNVDTYFTKGKRDFCLRVICPCSGKMIQYAKVKIKDMTVDLDIDSDNDHITGTWFPSSLEDDIEEDGYGKIIPTNIACESENGKPDYANMETFPSETSIVPMSLSIAERLTLDNIKVKIIYDGSPTVSDFSMIAPDTHNGETYYNYETLRESNAFRIWLDRSGVFIKNSNLFPIGNYLPPSTYTGTQIFGNSSVVNGRRTIRLYLEAIRAKKQDVITVEVTDNSHSPARVYRDTIRLTAVEGNITLNVDNDSTFTLSTIDDAYEDQNGGFHCWYNDKTDKTTSNGLENVFPLRVIYPQYTIDGVEYKIILHNVYGRIFENPIEPYSANLSVSSTERLFYLSDEFFYNLARVGFDNSSNTISVTSDMIDKEKEYLFYYNPNNLPTGKISLVMYPHGISSAFVVLDTCNITLSSIDEFFSMVSARNTSGARAQTYALDNGTSETFTEYAPMAFLNDFAMPNEAFEKYLLFIHGYNVDLEGAKDWNRTIFRRMYWTGFRGNFIGVTWGGDEWATVNGTPTPFSPNEENAMKTAPVFLDFFKDTIQGNTYATKPENITIMAHSLGNLLMWDMLRLYCHEYDNIAAQNTVSIQAAVWEEAFADRASISYVSPSDPITYHITDLEQHSWAFWFNQDRKEASKSVVQRINSYTSSDEALEAMQLHDRLIFLDSTYYNRSITTTMPSRNIDKLTESIPTLLRRSKRKGGITWYGNNDINAPLGLSVADGSSPEQFAKTGFFNTSIDATTLGWSAKGHSDLKGLLYWEIFEWYNAIWSSIK